MSLLTGCETAHALSNTTDSRAKAAYQITFADLANAFANAACDARNGIANTLSYARDSATSPSGECATNILSESLMKSVGILHTHTAT